MKRLSLVLLPLAFAACSDDPQPTPADTGVVEPKDAGFPDAEPPPPMLGLSVLARTIPDRVVPDGTLHVALTVRNTSDIPWDPPVELVFTSTAPFTNTTLVLTTPATIAPQGLAFFAGDLGAPAPLGFYSLSWRAKYVEEMFGDPIEAIVEVTCSDGLFCNGEERWFEGDCIARAAPCDDGIACTTDQCDEDTDTCTQVLVAPCDRCESGCTADCTGRTCGDDGCGGSCGTCTSTTTGCALGSGACVSIDQPGSCSDPLPMTPGNEPAKAGIYTVSANTNGAIHQVTPVCTIRSTGPELVYMFVTTSTLGLEARVTGYNTVLHLRKGTSTATSADDCLDDGNSIGCSNDAVPPGNRGSRVAVRLVPGRYYLIVDGFTATDYGPFTLTAKFANAGCVPVCDGRLCGDDDMCGGNCGICPMPLACRLGRCVEDPCVRECAGKECGDDGCNGQCGVCNSPEICVPSTGTCESFPTCDPEMSTCTETCGADAFCGTDCACHVGSDPQLPDLIVDREVLVRDLEVEDLNVDASSCTITDGCTAEPGLRRILRFTLDTINQGRTPLAMPRPADRPDLFETAQCPTHPLFKGFMHYTLLDAAGNVVIDQTRSESLEDQRQLLVGPNVPCARTHVADEGTPGLQQGWHDVHLSANDCQWLDITGLAPGDYVFRVDVNAGRYFEEASFENNVLEIPVLIPAQ